MSPSPEQFMRDFWPGVLTQFVIQRRHTQQLIVSASAFNSSLRNGFAHVAVVMDPRYIGRVVDIEASTLFLDYLFTHFPVRKLYAKTPGWNLHQFATGSNRLFREEERLRTHEFYAGRYWDLSVFAIYRADWEQRMARRRNRRSAAGSHEVRHDHQE